MIKHELMARSPSTKRKAETQYSRSEQETIAKADEISECVQRKLEEMANEDVLLKQLQEDLEKQYPVDNNVDEKFKEQIKILEQDMDQLHFFDEVIDK